VITRADMVARVSEWGLTEEVIEKDYVLGWLLWGIGADPVLGQSWIFKGGTCLKKCYIETYRFSEDLDFTVLPGGPYLPDDIAAHLMRMLDRVADASGINFATRDPVLRLRPDGLSVEGRVYYVGPRQQLQPARVKLDITANERVVRPPVLRDIGHPYPDALPGSGQVRCYSFEELFAEKLRAMAQRGRPRDLYDVINLFRRNDLRLYPDLIRDALAEKCAVKNIPVPTALDILNEERTAELEADWPNMLSHQLPALPPLAPFLEELLVLFSWLEGSILFEQMPPIPYAADEDQDWSPPATVWVWLLAATPLLPLIGLLQWDIKGYLRAFLLVGTSGGTGSGRLVDAILSPSYFVLLGLGFLTFVLCVVFALLDYYELKKRSIPRPFHWAWSFLQTGAVYIIGRAVIVRRRTGRGLAPLWVWIGVWVLTLIVGIAVLVSALAQIAPLLGQYSGNLSG